MMLLVHAACRRCGPADAVVPCLQLAARIAVSNLHKSTLKSFSETCVAYSQLSLPMLPLFGRFSTRFWQCLTAQHRY